MVSCFRVGTLVSPRLVRAYRQTPKGAGGGRHPLPYSLHFRRGNRPPSLKRQKEFRYGWPLLSGKINVEFEGVIDGNLFHKTSLL